MCFIWNQYGHKEKYVNKQADTKFILLHTRLLLPKDSHHVNASFCKGGRCIACPIFPQNIVTQLPSVGAGCITLCTFGMQGGCSDWCSFLFQRMIQSINNFFFMLVCFLNQCKENNGVLWEGCSSNTFYLSKIFVGTFRKDLQFGIHLIKCRKIQFVLR